MRRRVLIALLVVGAALSVDGRSEPGTLELRDPRTGATVAVEAGARATHLAFFATWCPSCVEELGRLVEFETRWSGRGYRLILVGVRTRQSAERLAEFVAAEDPPGRVLFDAEGQAEARYGVTRLPAHIVLDGTGREVARSSEFDAKIESALAGLLDERRGDGRER